MSDLHRPVTLLIARHGDAEYAVGHGKLTSEGGTLSEKGRAQVAAMAQSLVGTDVAAVVSSDLQRARESAAIVGQVLGLEPRVIGGVQEYEVGDFDGRPYADPDVQAIFARWAAGDLTAGFPGGETGRHIVDRYREALTDLATTAPGERVVVISHGGVMSLAIPRLSANVRDDLALEQFLPNAVPATVLVDADGMRVESWPGSADKHVV